MVLAETLPPQNSTLGPSWISPDSGVGYYLSQSQRRSQKDQAGLLRDVLDRIAATFI